MIRWLEERDEVDQLSDRHLAVHVLHWLHVRRFGRVAGRLVGALARGVNDRRHEFTVGADAGDIATEGDEKFGRLRWRREFDLGFDLALSRVGEGSP